MRKQVTALVFGVLAVVALVAVWVGLDRGGFATAGGTARARLERLRTWGREHRGELVDELASMVEVPSVSAEPVGVERMAAALRTRLEALDFEVHDLGGGGAPLLLARPAAPPPKRRRPGSTVLFYAHYDGQNVESERWRACRPFEPKLLSGHPADPSTGPVEDGAVLEDDFRLCGRGAADDKAPIAMLLKVLEGIRDLRLGQPAVSVKILLEGQEESGSPHLATAFSDPGNRELLASDVVVTLDGPVFPTGQPTLVFGVRGILTLDLTVYGANVDLHSGHYGNWAPNPAQELAWVLASLKDPFTGEVRIPEFYGCRTALSEAEERALTAVPDIDAQLREQFTLSRVETRWSLKESITHPSFNVRGLAAADVGDGARTAIPARAEAAIDIRLVKGCTGDHMTQLVRRQLEKLGYHVVEDDPSAAVRAGHERVIRLTRRGGGYDAVRTAIDLDVSRALAAAVERGAGETPVVLPTMGGSLPLAQFERHLAVPIVGLPLVNHDNGQHGPDEAVRLGHLWRGFDTLAAVVLTLGQPW